MIEEKIRILEVLALKEELLSQIIVWLRAKGLYEEATKDISLLPKYEVKNG